MSIPDSALPGVLREVARVAGAEVAVAIARAFGGRTMYLPAEPGRAHALTRAIGPAAARLVCRTLGHGAVEWPSAQAYLRWHDARRMRAEGRTVGAIAGAIGTSERWAAKLVAGVERGSGAVDEGDDRGRGNPCPACGHRTRARSSRSVDPRQLPLL